MCLIPGTRLLDAFEASNLASFVGCPFLLQADLRSNHLQAVTCCNRHRRPPCPHQPNGSLRFLLTAKAFSLHGSRRMESVHNVYSFAFFFSFASDRFATRFCLSLRKRYWLFFLLLRLTLRRLWLGGWHILALKKLKQLKMRRNRDKVKSYDKLLALEFLSVHGICSRILCPPPVPSPRRKPRGRPCDAEVRFFARPCLSSFQST